MHGSELQRLIRASLLPMDGSELLFRLLGSLLLLLLLVLDPRGHELFGGLVMGHVHAGLTVLALDIGGHAGLQELPHSIGVVLLVPPASPVHAGEAVLVHVQRVQAHLRQGLDDARVALEATRVHRGVAVILTDGWVSTSHQQDLHNVRGTPEAGSHERRLPPSALFVQLTALVEEFLHLRGIAPLGGHVKRRVVVIPPLAGHHRKDREAQERREEDGWPP
mmetsp:Transcript_51483/g.115825  ORF Transcript_51483/g.115825 Transcript_51483/m.115825 type:complete len:221 (-) Transcript_51483:100-762(-)